jgi:redox-sensitive bicupin YhaK (pirin superfamily)
MTETVNPFVLRKGGDRGEFDFGWLRTRHTFSFGDYRDPEWTGFSDLLVINEDRIGPGGGDMEILTWVVEGALEHRDSLGNGEILRPGEIQRMSAGSGVRHSEANPSDTEGLHLLQIWIQTAHRGDRPSYEQKPCDPQDLRDKLALIASPAGEGGAVSIHQDVRLLAGRLSEGTPVVHEVKAGRSAWIQVVKGRVETGGFELEAGDGLGVRLAQPLAIVAQEPSEILVFDLRG